MSDPGLSVEEIGDDPLGIRSFDDPSLAVSDEVDLGFEESLVGRLTADAHDLCEFGDRVVGAVFHASLYRFGCHMTMFDA